MRQMQIIWGAIVTSTVMYAAIAYAIAAGPSSTMEETLRNPLVLVLYGAALAAFVAAMVVRRALADAPSRVRMVVSLAIFETCAIFGLVAAFIQHDWRLYLAPWALAIAGFILSRPTEESDLLPRTR